MEKMLKGITGVILIFAIMLAAALCSAQEGESKTLSPYFFVEGGDSSTDQFPLKETDIRVRINGVIADVTIKQKYANQGKKPINARYVFPASTRAAVQGMKMIFGDQVITARIKEKEAAQKEFDEAKSKGKSASLLHQDRPNVFSMNVANVMPGDIITVELRYTELLVPTEGIYEFVYPTVVGPRYSSQAQEGAAMDDKWIQSPYQKKGKLQKSKWNISVELAAGMDLQDVTCSSHEALIQFASPINARITLADKEKNEGGNRDFILGYRLAGQAVQTGLMMYDIGPEKYFLLMVQPPQRVVQKDIPPREYIFVVDVSGSMHGFPLDISKDLLKNLIGSLRSKDKFNVILFSGGSRVMSATSLPATKDNIQEAIRLIEQQNGGGGTELLAALKHALSIPRDDSFSRTVIVVTDGFIGAERDVFDTIRQNLSRTNFFGFGIGSSVNRHLIEGIARAGLGEPFIITKQEDAPREAQRFCKYIKSPVLKDVQIGFEGFDAYDMEPAAIPELFAERPLVIIGKWRGEAKGQIRISGIGGRGNFSRVIKVADFTPMESNSALPYLWARTRIAGLSDFSGREEDPDRRSEITRLGLHYSLLTKYTSFIAVRDVVRNPNGKAADVQQPLPLPQGVSNLAVGNSGTSVPEPEFYLLAIMMLTAMIAAFVWRRSSRRASWMQ